MYPNGIHLYLTRKTDPFLKSIWHIIKFMGICIAYGIATAALLSWSCILFFLLKMNLIGHNLKVMFTKLMSFILIVKKHPLESSSKSLKAEKESTKHTHIVKEE